MMTATSSDSGALTTSTTTETTPVRTAPKALMPDAADASPASRSWSQWRTMPLWLMVKLTKTPTE